MSQQIALYLRSLYQTFIRRGPMILKVASPVATTVSQVRLRLQYKNREEHLWTVSALNKKKIASAFSAQLHVCRS